METVKWKMDGFYNADAQKVYQEIGSTNITPEMVLEKAKDENTELHKCFEWDDGIAAHKYRIEQARHVIRFLVKVPEKEEEQPRRVFQISSQTNTYQPTIFFQKNEDEYKRLLERAMLELRAFKKRYSMLSELEPILEAIDSI